MCSQNLINRSYPPSHASCVTCHERTPLPLRTLLYLLRTTPQVPGVLEELEGGSRRGDHLELLLLRGHDDGALLDERVRRERPLLDRRARRLRWRRPLAHDLDAAVGHPDLLLVAD